VFDIGGKGKGGVLWVVGDLTDSAALGLEEEINIHGV